jgi:hypothetical protein
MKITLDITENQYIFVMTCVDLQILHCRENESFWLSSYDSAFPDIGVTKEQCIQYADEDRKRAECLSVFLENFQRAYRSQNV